MTIQITVNAGGGADHLTVAAAIAALPAPAGWADDYEILIEDSSTYTANQIINIDATVFPLVIKGEVSQTPSMVGSTLYGLHFLNSSFITLENIIFGDGVTGVGVQRGIHSVVTDIDFVDCIFDTNASIAMDFGGGGAGNNQRCTWTGCTFQTQGNATCAAIDGIATNSDDCIFRDCLFKDAQVLLAVNNCDALIFDRNRVENISNTGLNCAAATNLVITNNIFDRLDCNGGPVVMGAGCTGFEIYNNTFSTTGVTPSPSINVFGTATGGAIKNNTFLMTNLSADYAIQHAAAAAADIDYNIYYRIGAGPGATPASPGADICFEVAATTLVAWQALGHDANGQEIDPGHTDETSGDYAPATGVSATVDAGVLLATVTTDFLGLARPVLTQDVGAYEFGALLGASRTIDTNYDLPLTVTFTNTATLNGSAVTSPLVITEVGSWEIIVNRGVSLEVVAFCTVRIVDLRLQLIDVQTQSPSDDKVLFTRLKRAMVDKGVYDQSDKSVALVVDRRSHCEFWANYPVYITLQERDKTQAGAVFVTLGKTLAPKRGKFETETFAMARGRNDYRFLIEVEGGKLLALG